MSTIIIPDSIRSARGEAPKRHTPFAILAMAIVCLAPVVALIWAVC